MRKSLFKAFAVGLGFAASLFVSGKAVAQVPSYVPSNGLVGWWPFNGNASDESGNGNNGTVNGAILTTDRFGNANKAYSFDGNDWIELNLLPAINNSNELAVSLWVKSTGTNSNTNCSVGCAQYYFSRGYDGSNGFFINSSQGNNPYFSCSVNGPFAGGKGVNSPSTTAIPHTQWYHLLINYDGINVKFYVNGSLVGTTPYTTNVAVGNTTNAVFGRQFVPNYPYYAVGKIDDGAIWNRALTQQEISALYSGCNLNPVITNNIVGVGLSTQLSTINQANTSYQWQTNGVNLGWQNIPNNLFYSGATTNLLTVNNVQLTNHNQPFRVIASSGNCVDTSNIAVIQIADTCITNVYDTILTTVTDTLIINTTLGLPAPNNVNTIQVYPNPTNDHITIDYGNYAIMNGYQLKIENSLGQQVFQTAINQQSSYLDLSSWGGNGIYYVHIIDPQSNTIDIRKIVLQ